MRDVLIKGRGPGFMEAGGPGGPRFYACRLQSGQWMLSKSNAGDRFFAIRVSCFSETKELGWSGGEISGCKERRVLLKSSFFTQKHRVQVKPSIARL